jgi:hypothetical protein
VTAHDATYKIRCNRLAADALVDVLKADPASSIRVDGTVGRLDGLVDIVSIVANLTGIGVGIFQVWLATHEKKGESITVAVDVDVRTDKDDHSSTDESSATVD